MEYIKILNKVQEHSKNYPTEPLSKGFKILEGKLSIIKKILKNSSINSTEKQIQLENELFLINSDTYNKHGKPQELEEILLNLKKDFRSTTGELDTRAIASHSTRRSLTTPTKEKLEAVNNFLRQMEAANIDPSFTLNSLLASVIHKTISSSELTRGKSSAGISSMLIDCELKGKIYKKYNLLNYLAKNFMHSGLHGISLYNYKIKEDTEKKKILILPLSENELDTLAEFIFVCLLKHKILFEEKPDKKKFNASYTLNFSEKFEELSLGTAMLVANSFLFLSKPKPWKLNEFGQLYGGGYLLNCDSPIHPLFKCVNSTYPVEYQATTEMCSVINSMQDTSYRINQKNLLHVQNNFFDCVTNLFCIKKEDEKDKNLNCLFDTNLNIKTLKTYLEENNLFIKPQLTDVELRIFMFNKAEYKKNYLRICQLFLDVLLMTMIAIELEHIEFYFKITLDPRGRVYKGEAIIGPTGNALSQFLVELVAENLYTYEDIKNIPSCFPLKKLTENSIGKNYFSFHKYVKGLFSTINLDASQQGCSIISGLTGFKEGLISTNVLTLPCLNGKPELKDYYTEIMTASSNFYSKKLEENDLSTNERNFLNNYLSYSSNNREHAKSWVMKLPYNQKSLTRAKELLDNVVLKRMVLDLNDPKVNKEFFSYAIKVANTFSYFLGPPIEKFRVFTENTFKAEMKERSKRLQLALDNKETLRLYTSWLTKSLKLSKDLDREKTKEASDLTSQQLEYLDSLNILWDGSFSDKEKLFTQKKNEESACKGNSIFTVGSLESGLIATTFHGETISESIAFISAERRKSSHNVNRIGLIPDSAQIIRASMANFIQSIDARILFKVLIKCNKQNIPISTNHDCYTVEVKYSETVQRFYFESFCEIVLQNNYLENFFTSNIIYSSLNNNYLTELKTLKENVLNSIKTQELVKSPFILKS